MKMSAAFLLIATTAVLLSASVSAKNIVCYFASWSIYRPGSGRFDVDNIDPYLCTHILYGFVGITEEGKINILDEWESGDEGMGGFTRLANLTAQNPDLKIMVSMGGWSEGSQKYSEVAADPVKRQTLVEDVVKFLDEHNFHGFDLDWEYPGVREGSDPINDSANFVQLLKELKFALQLKGYLLSAAVAGEIKYIDVAYDVPLVSEYLDIINVMTYIYHGSFEPFVGHTAPLTASSKDDAGNATLNVESSIQYWIDKGADPAKIHLGLTTFGRTFTLADPDNAELYAPALGGGTAGPYTRQEGVIGYNEICELYDDYTYIWDKEQQVPHRVSGDQWLGYDDEMSLRLKVKYANEMNLGGVMVWSFDGDDFRGLCGGETYPLLHAIKQTLNNE